ncbi:MAG TPA: cell division protein SepF [Acidimicrobiia bacterium]|nr:cell division protein SepF [Acidimicrobiia bacterium]
MAQDSLFNKALVYLGLVDEDQIDEQEGSYVETSAAPASDRGRQALPLDEGRRVEPAAASSRTVPPRRSTEPSIAGVRQIRPEAQADILVIDEFGDAKILADRVRDRVPVVLDFRRVDDDLSRRVVDFASGLIYALDGTMSRVGKGLVLVLPPATRLDADEKRRLASLGAYELPIE